MAKMIDLGVKQDGGAAVPSPIGESKKYYPSIFLEKVPEELMDKEVDGLCRLEIVARIESKSVNENDTGKRKSMRLEIQKMGLIGKAGKKTKEEYMKMTPTEREEYDTKEIHDR